MPPVTVVCAENEWYHYDQSLVGKRGGRGPSTVTGQYERWKMEVRQSLVTFGAHGLRVVPVHADHSERIHFFHRSREQGAFCRNSLVHFMGQ